MSSGLVDSVTLSRIVLRKWRRAYLTAAAACKAARVRIPQLDREAQLSLLVLVGDALASRDQDRSSINCLAQEG